MRVHRRPSVRPRHGVPLSTIRWRSRPPPWLRLPSIKSLALAGAVALICASLAVTVLMYLQHRHVQQNQQRAAEFAAAARQSVVTMLTIDPVNVRKNMDDVIANSTGKF